MDISQDPPERQIRTDLWKTMSVSDLYKQRDLLVDKIGTVYNLIAIDPSPTVQHILTHLRLNMDVLRQLIDQKVGNTNDRLF